MRSIHQWLDEYHQSHQNRHNKILHWVCVPLIVLSLLGFLWLVDIPLAISGSDLNLNLAVLIMFFATLYYLYLSWSLALGMLLIFTLMLFFLYLLSQLHIPLWFICSVIFIAAWIGQFIGHKIEGKQPSFFEDLRFLLIGPLWLLSFIYKKLDINY